MTIDHDQIIENEPGTMILWHILIEKRVLKTNDFQQQRRLCSSISEVESQIRDCVDRKMMRKEEMEISQRASRQREITGQKRFNVKYDSVTH